MKILNKEVIICPNCNKEFILELLPYGSKAECPFCHFKGRLIETIKDKK